MNRHTSSLGLQGLLPVLALGASFGGDERAHVRKLSGALPTDFVADVTDFALARAGGLPSPKGRQPNSHSRASGTGRRALGPPSAESPAAGPTIGE